MTRFALSIWLVVAAGFAIGCGRPAASPDPRPVVERAFELSCTGSATNTSGSVYCVRLETRTGAVLRVDLSRLPISNGPTNISGGSSGLFQLSCAALNMAERSDFSCVRLDTQTGEMLVVNLQKVGQLPGS